MQNNFPEDQTEDSGSMEKAVDDLMEDYDLSHKQAHLAEKLEDEGYDEEDAVNQAMDEEAN